MQPDFLRNDWYGYRGQVRSGRLNAPETVPDLKASIEQPLDQSEVFCASEGLSTVRFVVYAADPVESLESRIADVSARFPDSVCFANKLILPANRWFAEWLHNQTALGLQRQLHLEGILFVILPIKLG